MKRASLWGLAISAVFMVSLLTAQVATYPRMRLGGGSTGNLVEVDADSNLAVVNRMAQTATSATTQVTCGAASGTLLASNVNRVVALVQDVDATDSAYICYGATCSAALATAIVRPADMAHREDVYTGVISCLRTAAADATINVTEVSR